MKVILPLIILLFMNTAQAQNYDLPTHLSIPIECEVNANCFIQNYVDTDADKDSYKDYKCGGMTYDTHDGTDFRIKNYVEMEKGIAVLAAADGTVMGIRDGLIDASIHQKDPASYKNMECGNGVVIDHGKGLITQYCHMKNGSLAVGMDEKVTRGQKLGLVGMSGKTEFPHLHFSVRDLEQDIDPFTGWIMGEPCSSTQRKQPYWTQEASNRLAYQDNTTILDAGFTISKPTVDSVLSGQHSLSSASKDAPAIVLWGIFIGAKSMDNISLNIYMPDGNLINSYTKTMEKARAQQFLYTGKTNTVIKQWPAGTYKGVVVLSRNDEAGKAREISRRTVELTVLE